MADSSYTKLFASVDLVQIDNSAKHRPEVLFMFVAIRGTRTVKGLEVPLHTCD